MSTAPSSCSPAIHHSHPKTPQPRSRQSAQANRQRLLRLDRTRNTGSRQNHTREQRELDTVGGARLHAVGAQGVDEADAAAGYEGGDGAGADLGVRGIRRSGGIGGGGEEGSGVHSL